MRKKQLSLTQLHNKFGSGYTYSYDTGVNKCINHKDRYKYTACTELSVFRIIQNYDEMIISLAPDRVIFKSGKNLLCFNAVEKITYEENEAFAVIYIINEHDTVEHAIICTTEPEYRKQINGQEDAQIIGKN